ncbi:MAG: ComEA family DNA-binding protein [Olsenella sp.]|nr:ComEA family DNA-binding protein [Olsenella sp.]
MAQMHGKRSIRLLERLGLRGRRATILACMAIAAILCGVGALSVAQRGRSFSVERGVSAERQNVPENSERSSGGEDKRGSDGGASEDDGQTVPTVVVHVDGAVVSPGVFELEGDALRLRDAVDAAGGLAPEADTTGLNLAERVSDGQKVHVPAWGESAAFSSGGAQTGAASGATGDASSAAVPRLVNINTATADELQALSGVGEATARAIVEDRSSNGPFVSPEDLMRVSGIGEKKFEKLKGSICV